MVGRKICKIGYGKYIRNNGSFNGSLTQLPPWTFELSRDYNMQLSEVTMVKNPFDIPLKKDQINALTVNDKLILMQFSLNASVLLPCLIVPESVGRHSTLSISCFILKYFFNIFSSWADSRSDHFGKEES